MSTSFNENNNERRTFEELEDMMNIPKVCEFPGCGSSRVNMTHNFDTKKWGKLKDTFHKRNKMTYDYIYVCGYHLQELMPYYNDRVKALSGGNSNVPFIPSKEVEGKKWSDPIR